MKQARIIVLVVLCIVFQVQSQTCTNKIFTCNETNLSEFTHLNIVSKCPKDTFCNAKYLLDDGNKCKPCVSKNMVCEFSCITSKSFQLAKSDEIFDCPGSSNCNEKMMVNCNPCFYEVCSDPKFWQCSETDKTAFTYGKIDGFCKEGFVCKTQNIPPCYDPCIEETSVSSTEQTAPTTFPTSTAQLTTTETSTKQPSTTISTIPSTTQPPPTTVFTTSSTTKQPSTTIFTTPPTTTPPSTTILSTLSTTKPPSTTIFTTPSTSESPSTTISTTAPTTIFTTPSTTTPPSTTQSVTTSSMSSTTPTPTTLSTETSSISSTSTSGETTPSTIPTTTSKTETTTTSTATTSTTPSTEISSTLSTSTSIETTPSTGSTTTARTTTTSQTTVSTYGTSPPFKLPDCNDGHADTNPCRPGPSNKVYYYKCIYYSPVWYDYEVKLCKYLASDRTCMGKVC